MKQALIKPAFFKPPLIKQALASSVEMMSIAWRTDRRRMALAVALMTLGGAAWPLLALTLKVGIDLVVDRRAGAAAVAGALVATVAIAALVLAHLAYVPYAEASELAVMTLESELIDLANGSTLLAHQERADYADRTSMLQKELTQFSDGMMGLMALLALAVSMGTTGSLLALVNPALLLLPVAAVVPMLAIQRAQRIVDAAKRETATQARRAEHLFELATSAAPAKELRVFGLRDEIRGRHRRLWRGVGRRLLRGELRATAVDAAGQVVFAMFQVAAVVLVLRQTIAGRSRVGDVVLVIVLATQIHQQVTAALDLYRRMQRVAHGMTRLRWLRAVVAGPPSDDGGPATPGVALVPDRIRRGIELRGVGFTYPGRDRPALSGVDLVLPAGSTVAIVGENGAGKSTLVKLLCRFYDSTDGTIEVDGVDLRRFGVDRWRSRVAAGFQDFARFEFLARQAVGVGDRPRMDDQAAVLAALRRADAEDVVSHLDHGLSTQLGQAWTDGVELSGGQWQRLALGRAMMRESPLLLILDEPTAALDAEAEHRLFERYADNARRVGRETGAITVLVSHRFSTVRMADLILVVVDGRIAEQGDHADLLRRDGVYAALYGLQASAYRT